MYQLKTLRAAITKTHILPNNKPEIAGLFMDVMYMAQLKILCLDLNIENVSSNLPLCNLDQTIISHWMVLDKHPS